MAPEQIYRHSIIGPALNQACHQAFRWSVAILRLTPNMHDFVLVNVTALWQAGALLDSYLPLALLYCATCHDKYIDLARQYCRDGALDVSDIKARQGRLHFFLSVAVSD